MNSEKINRLIEQTLESVTGAERAKPKPFLYTRLMAKMQNNHSPSWDDNTLRFLSKPAVAFACVLAVIIINAAVFSYSHPAQNLQAAEEAISSTDDYSNAVAVLNDIENTEP